MSIISMVVRQDESQRVWNGEQRYGGVIVHSVPVEDVAKQVHGVVFFFLPIGQQAVAGVRHRQVSEQSMSMRIPLEPLPSESKVAWEAELNRTLKGSSPQPFMI